MSATLLAMIQLTLLRSVMSGKLPPPTFSPFMSWHGRVTSNDESLYDQATMCCCRLEINSEEAVCPHVIWLKRCYCWVALMTMWQTLPESPSIFSQLCSLTNTHFYKHRDSTFQWHNYLQFEDFTFASSIVATLNPGCLLHWLLRISWEAFMARRIHMIFTGKSPTSLTDYLLVPLVGGGICIPTVCP
jgi:hypothetical protein